MRLLLLNAFLIILNSSFVQKDWQLQSNENGIKLWTKNLDGSKLLQFKAETILKSDLEPLYHAMRDVEKMHTWYDKVKKVILLKKINETEGIYLLEYGLPMPFENRVSTLKGTIDYDKSKGNIKVTTNYFPFKIPEKYSDYPLIATIKSAWEIESQNNGFVKITHSGYMDPGGNIPLWLTNESVTTGPIKSLKNLKKLLKIP